MRLLRSISPNVLVGALTRRRRHRFAPLVLLLAALASTGVLYAAVAPTPRAQAAGETSAASIQDGRALFLKNCSSCHGLNAEGTTDGPTLVGVGAAAVDFQVETGRMPAVKLGAQIQKKPNQFSDEEIAAMAAYVASLGPGPAIPSEEDLEYSDAEIGLGGSIYRTNCSMCHNYAGSGGALSGGKYAPNLRGVSPKLIWEAMITGPQSMPVFNNESISEEEKRALIGYLKTLEDQPAPGGSELGRIGPVAEGGVAWLVGMGALIACAVWLGAKAR